MESDAAKDPLKATNWKNIGKAVADESTSEPVMKKSLSKKIQNILNFYFLQRKTLPAAIVFYGSWILGGVGAWILVDIWINKKLKEDGGSVVWEFGKLMLHWLLDGRITM